MTHYDLIVIGSGAGLKIAFASAEKGLRTLLIEKEYLGGTCLNKGCIPSKMFIAPADFLISLNRSTFMNLTSLSAQADFSAIAKRTSQLIKNNRDHIKTKISTTENLSFLNETVFFSGKNEIQTSKGIITGKKIVLATGMTSQAPNVQGIENTPFLTSTDVLNFKELPKSMLILGGGYIACEMAHYLSAYGVDVTLMVRSSILRKKDQETVNIFRKSFQKKIKLMEKTLPENITYENKQFIVTLNNQKLQFDQLLVATGQIPMTQDLKLEKASIEVDEKGFIKVDENLKTTMDNIYALGDCIGHYFFRHSANFQSEYLISHLFNNNTLKIEYPPMPHAIFSNPEIAAVGYTEEELKLKNIPYVIGRALFSESNMGLARAYQEGQVKLLISPKDETFLGVHIVGEDAATLIHSFVTAITFNHTINDYLKTIFIHPAITETLKEAVLNAKQKIK